MEGRIRAVLCLVYFGAGRDGRLKTSILGPYGVIWCHMVPVLPVLPLGPDAPWARPWPCGPGRGPVGQPWARAARPPAVTFDTWFVIADRGQWPRRRLSEIFRSDHAKSYQLSYVSYMQKQR